MAAAVLLGTPSARAGAQGEASGAAATARELVHDAELDFELGLYAQALRAFREAYALSSHPELLFNIAQCYMQLGEYERALHHYRSYWEQRPYEPHRELVRKRIAEAKHRIEFAARGGPRDHRGGPVKLAPRPRRLTEHWWFWGSAVALVAGGAALALSMLNDGQVVPPASVGTLDRR